MKAPIEKWDESFLDLEDYQVERASTRAALDAIYRARQFGVDVVIDEDDQIKHLKPNETEPYEKRLLESLEKLNRKIAELQAQNPNALSLNERPGELKP